jgi:hypothetical protein
MAIRDDLRVQTKRSRDLNRTQKIHGMNVKSAVAVRDVQQTLSNVQEVLCEELQALQGAPSQRAKDDCVRRIKQSAIVMKQALELQKSNIAKIRGAGRSAYVKRTLGGFPSPTFIERNLPTPQAVGSRWRADTFEYL